MKIRICTENPRSALIQHLDKNEPNVGAAQQTQICLLAGKTGKIKKLLDRQRTLGNRAVQMEEITR